MKLFIPKLPQGIFAVLLMIFFISSCAPLPRGGTAEQAIKEAMEPEEQPRQEKKAPPPPPDVRSALIPQLMPPRATQPEREEVRFDIAASQVPAREFFMGLVEGSPVNMVVHPEVKGEISVDLKNTTISEVLQVIYNVYGYPYAKTANVYQVMPAALQARTFQVNYLNLVRKGSSRVRVSSGQVSQVDSDDNDNDDVFSDNNNNGENSQVTGSQIDTESEADFWSELQAAVQGLVGSEDGRKVIVQPQASVVVVVAMPDELSMVADYLNAIQRNLQRQVILEAKVIEVTLNDGFQSGINWTALAQSSGNGLRASQVGGGTIFDDSTPVQTSVGLDTSTFGGVFTLDLDFGDFQAFVELLETQGDVQILSSPRISTINNQKAVIKVGNDEFFVTDVSSDTTTGTATNNSQDITLTPFFSGIALDVTPQVDETGQITLHIHPTVSDVVDQDKTITVFGEDLTLPLAFSTVRESDSIVSARSGQLVVIGGLMEEITKTEEAGVPFLSDLPGVGALFKNTQSRSQKTELLILLRPQVITSQADWDANIEASRQRVDRMAPDLNQDWRQRRQW